MALIDDISPVTVGEDKIKLTLDPASDPPLANRPITINVDYSDADPNGVVLPLRFVLQPAFGGGGAGNGYDEYTYRNVAPSTLTVQVANAGEYLLLLKECFHNRWQGRLILNVEGDPFTTEVETERS